MPNSIKNKIKSTIRKYVLRPLKLQVVNPNLIADLREQIDCPIRASYEVESKEFLINCYFDQCIGMIAAAYKFGQDSKHPFVLSILSHIKGEDPKLPLEKYYQTYQPKNIAEQLGLYNKQVHPLLREPPTATFFPWSYEIKNKEQLVQRTTNRILKGKLEAYEHEFNIKDFGPAQYWGPINPHRIEFEAARLIRIYDSILKTGFTRSNDVHGDVKGNIMLSNNNENRILIHSGQHRISVVNALNFKSIPIRILPCFIRRSEVDFWPNVANGIFTREQALFIFDRIFNGHSLGG